jgi:hypothetical protein
MSQVEPTLKVKSDNNILCVVLEDEFEGDSPLYFNLNDPSTPEKLVNHLLESQELGVMKQYSVQEVPLEIFEQLES